MQQRTQHSNRNIKLASQRFATQTRRLLPLAAVPRLTGSRWEDQINRRSEPTTSRKSASRFHSYYLEISTAKHRSYLTCLCYSTILLRA